VSNRDVHQVAENVELDTLEVEATAKMEEEPTGGVAVRRAGTVRAPTTIEKVREGKCEREKEKLEKWTTAIPLDLLVHYQGAAQAVQP
jgi:hypothetical protein